MRGKIKSGFSIVELLLVVAIIGVAGSSFYLLMRKPLPRRVRLEILGNLNALMSTAWRRAVMTQKTYSVSFDIKHHVVSVHAEYKKDSKQKKDLSPAVTTMAWPPHLQIKEFFVEGTNEMHDAGEVTTRVWFYLIPDGLAQQVTINMLDANDMQGSRKKSVSFVLNPFNAQFKMYDEFKKPIGVLSN